MRSVVEARNLRFRYGTARRSAGAWALHDINLSLDPGVSLGIVGETGSGKSTLVRVLCGLLRVSAGSVFFDGRPVSDWLHENPQEFRRRNQLVFQSPANSLDPRMRVRRSLAEPVKAIEQRTPSAEEMETWLAEVGLSTDALHRYPHQLSGGQLQRVAIARALTVRPSILYADEPTSALDVSVQAQVLNLLLDLRARRGLTLLMVSHDLAVVSRLCEQIVVMRDGQVVEAGPLAEVLRSPRSDYTARLVDAAQAVSLQPSPVRARSAVRRLRTGTSGHDDAYR